MTKTTIQIRIEDKDKKDILKICSKFGITLSTLIRMYIKQVAITKDPFWYKNK
jgi:addiction module RelB/DinJ family antitoxin